MSRTPAVLCTARRLSYLPSPREFSQYRRRGLLSEPGQARQENLLEEFEVVLTLLVEHHPKAWRMVLIGRQLIGRPSYVSCNDDFVDGPVVKYHPDFGANGRNPCGTHEKTLLRNGEDLTLTPRLAGAEDSGNRADSAP